MYPFPLIRRNRLLLNCTPQKQCKKMVSLLCITSLFFALGCVNIGQQTNPVKHSSPYIPSNPLTANDALAKAQLPRPIGLRTWLKQQFEITPNTSKHRDAIKLITQIEKAHGAKQWRREKAIECDITVTFQGHEMIHGRFVFEPLSNKVRAELFNGTTLLFDGQKAFIWPADSAVKMPRFHVLTWPYFVSAPFKLNDRGTHFITLGPKKLQGSTYQAGQLTFDAGIGDSPKDWYITYADQQTNWLRAMAYIVSYGKNSAKAAGAPHAITFDDFAKIDGVTFSRQWTFWNWNKTQGIIGKPVGHGQVSRIHFVRPRPTTFIAPPNAKPLPLP